MGTWQKGKLDELEREREKINNRLKFLYGPLHGNRLLHNASIKAIENREKMSVTFFVQKICNEEDANALQNWRGYYVRQLMHFDEKAQDIILNHADLIVSDASRAVIQEFVEQLAEHKYNIEHWRKDGKWDKLTEYCADDFVIQNNNTDFETYYKLTEHVRETYDNLYTARKRLDHEMKHFYGNSTGLDSCLKLFTKK